MPDQDSTPDELMLESMHIQHDKMNATMSAGGPETDAVMLTMLDGMAAMLDEHDAHNYVEFELRRRGRSSVCVRIQRMHRPTPHDLRTQADERADRAEAALEHARRALQDIASTAARAHENQLHEDRTEGKFGSPAANTLRQITNTATNALGAPR